MGEKLAASFFQPISGKRHFTCPSRENIRWWVLQVHQSGPPTQQNAAPPRKATYLWWDPISSSGLRLLPLPFLILWGIFGLDLQKVLVKDEAINLQNEIKRQGFQSLWKSGQWLRQSPFS